MNLVFFNRRAQRLNMVALAVFLGLFLYPAFVYSEEGASQDFVISKIVVEGNKRIEADAIFEKMRLKVGSKTSKDAIHEDILKIFSLGFFEDLRLIQDGTVLKVLVKERPVIASIEFEGNEEFEKKDLDEASALKTFNVLNPKKIETAKTAIRQKYEQKGYYLAKVDAELVPLADKPNEVKVLFKIEERERVRVRKIIFRGNKVFSTPDLRRVMGTAENHAFSWATGGGSYKEDVFEKDLSILSYFYGNEGYIEAKFSKPRVMLSQDRKYIDAFVDVEEGKRFYLGDLSFRGDNLFTSEELRDSFAMKEKDVFSLGKLQEQIMKLTDKFGDRGYAFANVIPKTMIREGTDIVDLEIDIEKGEKVYWNRITITGNTKTYDKVLRRELPFNEGELYSATKRKKGLEHIKRLGFFGDNVNFLTSSADGAKDKLDLEIKIQEKPTGSLNVTAGWGSYVGFSLGAQVSQSNLFGRGQALSFNMMINSLSQTFNVSFTDPRVFDSQWLFGSDLYIDEQFPVIYKRRLSGGTLRTGREVGEDLMLLGSYKLEHSLLSSPVNPAIFTSPRDKESYISSVSLTLNYDTRNNRLDPSGGRFYSTSSEFAGLGGRVFQKFTGFMRFYARVYEDLVYRSNYEASVITDFVTHESIPDTERISLGGVFSLRGYPYYSVGPSKFLVNTRDHLTDPQYFVIGGTKKFVANQEFEFPLIVDAGIRSVLFFDVGNAWNSIAKSSPILLSDFGWGIRWYSPLGPLRFEFGYPLNRVNGTDYGMQFNFIIAPTF